MSESNFKNLANAILTNSDEKHQFLKAALEWSVTDCEEDDTNSAKCICGKENLRYLFTIINDKNGNQLFPIGSTCIKKFKRNDLDEITSINIALFKLLHAVSTNAFISLDTELFTRKLIYHLYKKGAFNTSYNNFDGAADYDFFLKMFNKRDKRSISQKQDGKIKAILLNSIKPFIIKLLKEKTNNKRISNENI